MGQAEGQSDGAARCNGHAYGRATPGGQPQANQASPNATSLLPPHPPPKAVVPVFTAPQTGPSNSNTSSLPSSWGQQQPNCLQQPREFLEWVFDLVVATDKEGYFLFPVTEAQAPNYHSVIKHPLCFADMRQKFAEGKYTSWRSLMADFELIVNNAKTFNSVKTKCHKCALALQRNVNKIMNQYELDVRKALSVLHPPLASTAAQPPGSSLPPQPPPVGAAPAPAAAAAPQPPLQAQQAVPLIPLPPIRPPAFSTAYSDSEDVEQQVRQYHQHVQGGGDHGPAQQLPLQAPAPLEAIMSDLRQPAPLLPWQQQASQGEHKAAVLQPPVMIDLSAGGPETSQGPGHSMPSLPDGPAPQGAAMQQQGQAPPLPGERHKVTPEWKRARRSVEWQCRWLELRMHELDAQIARLSSSQHGGQQDHSREPQAGASALQPPAGWASSQQPPSQVQQQAKQLAAAASRHLQGLKGQRDSAPAPYSHVPIFFSGTAAGREEGDTVMTDAVCVQGASTHPATSAGTAEPSAAGGQGELTGEAPMQADDVFMQPVLGHIPNSQLPAAVYSALEALETQLGDLKRGLQATFALDKAGAGHRPRVGSVRGAAPFPGSSAAAGAQAVGGSGLLKKPSVRPFGPGRVGSQVLAMHKGAGGGDSFKRKRTESDAEVVLSPMLSGRLLENIKPSAIVTPHVHEISEVEFTARVEACTTWAAAYRSQGEAALQHPPPAVAAVLASAAEDEADSSSEDTSDEAYTVMHEAMNAELKREQEAWEKAEGQRRRNKQGKHTGGAGGHHGPGRRSSMVGNKASPGSSLHAAAQGARPPAAGTHHHHHHHHHQQLHKQLSVGQAAGQQHEPAHPAGHGLQRRPSYKQQQQNSAHFAPLPPPAPPAHAPAAQHMPAAPQQPGADQWPAQGPAGGMKPAPVVLAPPPPPVSLVLHPPPASASVAAPAHKLAPPPPPMSGSQQAAGAGQARVPSAGQHAARRRVAVPMVAPHAPVQAQPLVAHATAAEWTYHHAPRKPPRSGAVSAQRRTPSTGPASAPQPTLAPPPPPILPPSQAGASMSGTQPGTGWRGAGASIGSLGTESISVYTTSSSSVASESGGGGAEGDDESGGSHGNGHHRSNTTSSTSSSGIEESLSGSEGVPLPDAGELAGRVSVAGGGSIGGGGGGGGSTGHVQQRGPLTSEQSTPASQQAANARSDSSGASRSPEPEQVASPAATGGVVAEGAAAAPAQAKESVAVAALHAHARRVSASGGGAAAATAAGSPTGVKARKQQGGLPGWNGKRHHHAVTRSQDQGKTRSSTNGMLNRQHASPNSSSLVSSRRRS